MLRPERSIENEEDEILYSDDSSGQSSDSISEESDDEWGINWDDLECVDELGEDDDTGKMPGELTSDDEISDVELDAVDELNESRTTLKTKEMKERERIAVSQDDKNESNDEKREGDPWSQWVGRINDDDKKEEDEMKKDDRNDGHSREEERKESSRKEKRDQYRRDEKRDHIEKKLGSRREEEKGTLAELVLKGMVSGGDVRRDKRSQGVGKSGHRRMTPPRRMHTSSPVRNEKSRCSPGRERRKDRSPRRVASSSIERRNRNDSPMRKEKRSSPSVRDMREIRDKISDERRIEKEGDGHRRDRSHFLHNKFSSPYRRKLIKSRSPIVGKRDDHSKISSHNRNKIGERSTLKEEKIMGHSRSRSPIATPRKDIPSLLDVKITPSLTSRMEGRVKRGNEMEEKRKEERWKDNIDRDGRDEQREEMTGNKEKKEDEIKEEKKKHIPIVWNDKATDATKKYRSIGHSEGMEMIKKDEKEEAKREIGKEKNMSTGMIPSSMMERVGKAKSLTVFPQSRPCTQQDSFIRKSIDCSHTRLQPMEVVRIIRNDEAVAPQSEIQKERNVVKVVEKMAEKKERETPKKNRDEKYDDDESGWLSVTLQQGRSAISMNGSSRSDKKVADPSSAALRLFGRAASSAVSSSSLKDIRPSFIKEVHIATTVPDVLKKGGKMKKKFKKKKDERIEIRPLLNDQIGHRRRRNTVNIGEKVSKSDQSGHPRLLEVYY